ncbi:MAG: tetratricopeptide repeat protein [Kiritimatiellia bacterium]
MSAPFLYDDFHYFVKNPVFRTLDWPWMFLTGTTRPVLYASLALNLAAGGWSSWAFHLGNLLILACSGTVLFGLLCRLKSRQIPVFVAFLIALLWVTHPVQANVTAYVWQRSESLVALFYLLTLYCFLRGVQRSKTPWLFCSAAACILGMAVKEVMVTAPFAVLLTDRTFISGSFPGALKRRPLFYTALTASWAVLGVLVGVNAGAFHENPSVGFGSALYSPWKYAVTMPGVLLNYMRLTILPTNLCFDPGRPAAENLADILIPLAAVLPLACVTLWGTWKKRPWGYALFMFFLILAPTSSVMPMPDPFLEYRLHLPLAALLSFGVLTGYQGISKFSRPKMRRTFRYLAFIFGLSALGVFFALSRVRLHDFRSGTAIWEDTFQKRPGNYRALNRLTWNIKQRGNPLKKYEDFCNLLRHEPDLLYARIAAARCAVALNNFTEARTHLKAAIETDPQYDLAYYDLGRIAEWQSDWNKARNYYRLAVNLSPSLVPAILGLARMQERSGNLKQALNNYKKAGTIWPVWATVDRDIVRVLVKMGRLAEAEGKCVEAWKAHPKNDWYPALIGRLRSSQGDRAGALRYLQAALNLNPDNPDTHTALGQLFASAGQTNNAATYLRRALDLNPGCAKARETLLKLKNEHRNAPGNGK